MNEAVFPILGPLIVIALVLPASALSAKLLLLALSRWGSEPSLHVHQGLRYAILVLSSAVPLAWFISASLHQAETGRSVLVCTAEHSPSGDCAEAAYFSLALSGVALLIGVPRMLWNRLVLRGSKTQRALAAQARVQRIIGEHARLAPLNGRVLTLDQASAPIATIGLLAPRVVLQSAFAESLDDESLAGALYHELQHFLELDPLRYFVGWWALAVNPLGSWLLRGDYARWLLAREAHCDRHAVLAGACPTALAKALVVAARPPTRPLLATLGSPEVEAVRLRLGLLLAYADRAPRRCSHGPGLRLVVAALVLVLALPHGGGTHALDALHAATERGLAFVAGP